MTVTLTTPSGAMSRSGVAPLSADRLAKVVAAIETWNLSFLAPALAAEHGWDEQRSHGAVQAYKQFMVIAACSHDAILSVPTIVDAAWHLHILHTVQYFQFCEAIAGRYIHHTPRPPGQEDTGTVDVVPLIDLYFGPSTILNADRSDCGNDPCNSCNRVNSIPPPVTEMFETWRRAVH